MTFLQYFCSIKWFEEKKLIWQISLDAAGADLFAVFQDLHFVLLARGFEVSVGLPLAWKFPYFVSLFLKSNICLLFSFCYRKSVTFWMSHLSLRGTCCGKVCWQVHPSLGTALPPGSITIYLWFFLSNYAAYLSFNYAMYIYHSIMPCIFII